MEDYYRLKSLTLRLIVPTFLIVLFLSIILYIGVLLNLFLFDVELSSFMYLVLFLIILSLFTFLPLFIESKIYGRISYLFYADRVIFSDDTNKSVLNQIVLSDILSVDIIESDSKLNNLFDDILKTKNIKLSVIDRNTNLTSNYTLKSVSNAINVKNYIEQLVVRYNSYISGGMQ